MVISIDSKEFLSPMSTFHPPDGGIAKRESEESTKQSSPTKAKHPKIKASLVSPSHKTHTVQVTKDPVIKKRPWTPNNKITLLTIASRRGASIRTFEGAIDGRTGLACYIQWR
jgi:AraC-like DNA-binding protein